MAVDIKQTLNDNISTDKVLNLVSTLFPGVIQKAIGYYLNGVTIPIGSSASLTVSKKEADLTVTMEPVVFDGTATSDKATLKVSGTGDYTDAYITLTFTKVSDSEVSIALDATMGDKLMWSLNQLWPDLLDHEPFTEVDIEKGQLTLSIDSKDNVDFSGTGALYYKNSQLAVGALKIIYDGDTSSEPDESKVSVLAGVEVDRWSPGTIWSALDDVTFEDSGLIFSSLSETDSKTLSQLNLISSTAVPSIVNGDFTVPAGISFFTTLQLDNFLAPLEQFLGKSETLALYANSNLSNKLTLIAQFAASNFKPSSNAIFEFDDFELEWDLDAGTSYKVIASANGHFFPPDGSPDGLKLTLDSTIDPSEGDISVGLDIADWAAPFGYTRLTVLDVAADFILGASADGVTVAISGDFQFTADDGNSFEFGVAGEIADFEVPTGIAFLIKDTDKDKFISIGDLINGITSLDTNKIPGISFINEILQIQDIDFAIVEGPSLTIGNKTFQKGFTADADFEILEQEEVIIDISITGDPGSEQFSALAELKEAVEIGSSFTLSAYDPTTKKPDTSKGPEIAVASKGQVLDGVNDGKPVYFYADGYLKILDIIKADLYGIATTDGLFEFVEDVQAGAKFGNTGVWGGDSITAGLNPSDYKFEASFDFNFGWENVSLGPLKIYDVTLIPKVSLPNFDMSAGLGIYVDGKALTFELKGELNFDFVGIHLNFGSAGNLKTIFKLDAIDVINSLDDIKDKVWSWLESNISDLLDEYWSDLSIFVSWLAKESKTLGLDIVTIATAMYNGFTKSVDDLVDALQSLGYSASEIYDVLVNSLGMIADEVEEAIDNAFETAKDCVVNTAAKL